MTNSPCPKGKPRHLRVEAPGCSFRACWGAREVQDLLACHRERFDAGANQRSKKNNAGRVPPRPITNLVPPQPFALHTTMRLLSHLTGSACRVSRRLRARLLSQSPTLPRLPTRCHPRPRFSVSHVSHVTTTTTENAAALRLRNMARRAYPSFRRVSGGRDSKAPPLLVACHHCATGWPAFAG